MKVFRGYIFSRSFMGERAPQHVQNIVLRDYCARNRLHYLLSATEYAMVNCHLILEQVLVELAEIDGIVVYSLFQMPINQTQRLRVYERILAQGKEIHFAVEGLSLTTQTDILRLEDIWLVRETLADCVSTSPVASGEKTWAAC